MDWIRWANLAMLATGATVVCQKLAVGQMGWRLGTLVDLAFGVVFITTFCWFNDGQSIIVEKVTRLGVVYAALAGLAGATAFISSNIALSTAKASEVVPIVAVAPAISMILSAFVMGERISLTQTVGASLALFGAYLVAVSR